MNYNEKIDKNIVLDYAIAGKYAAKCILDFRYSKQAPPAAANDIWSYETNRDLYKEEMLYFEV